MLGSGQVIPESFEHPAFGRPTRSTAAGVHDPSTNFVRGEARIQNSVPRQRRGHWRRRNATLAVEFCGTLFRFDFQLSGVMISPMEQFPAVSTEQAENRFESRELTSAERKNLVAAWVDIAVEDVEVPKDMEKWNDDDTRSWLSETMSTDVARLVKEWDLRPDEELVVQLQAEKDPSRRADIEMHYIESACAAITKFQKTRVGSETEGRSTKWDSWPKQMRETGQFNCVGGTLLGMNLLDQAGIRSFYGNPAGHVLNIVELSNGEWVYSDFRNNHIQKLTPEVRMIGGVETLIVDDPRLAYRLIPLLPNVDAPQSVLRNLSSALDCIAEEPHDSSSWKEAERIQSRFPKHLTENDFSDLGDNLYPMMVNFRQTKEARDERDRVDRIRKEKKTIASFFSGLSPEERKSVAREKMIRRKEIQQYVLKGDDAALSELSEPLQRNLPALREYLEKLRESDPEFYEDFISRAF